MFLLLFPDCRIGISTGALPLAPLVRSHGLFFPFPGHRTSRSELLFRTDDLSSQHTPLLRMLLRLTMQRGSTQYREASYEQYHLKIGGQQSHARCGGGTRLGFAF